MIRVGLTLPSFNGDPDVGLRVAVAAERAGIDGVFAYDHLFRIAPNGARRPALECFSLMTAVAVATRRITIGSLVARASLRAPKLLAQSFATLQSAAGRSIIAGIGAGDHESRVENESFGIGFGTLAGRIAQLDAAVHECVGLGLDVWVGGTHPTVRSVAATSNAAAWNRWGGAAAVFAREATEVRATSSSPIATTWGGLVVLSGSDAHARNKADVLKAPNIAMVGAPNTVAALLRPYVTAGASWLVLAPVDASDVSNVELIAEVRELLIA